jgi:predicted anti-sigma-YlaC factor YlaD
MLSCRQLTEQSTDYLERHLGLWGRLRVRLHLFLCQHCRRYLKQIEQTIGMLKELPKELPPPGLMEIVLEAFRKELRQGRP